MKSLGSTVPARLLLALALFLLAATRVHADCLPDAIDPNLILCTGTDSQGFAAAPGVDDLTVQIDAEATVTNADPGLADAIRVNDASTVTNRGTLSVEGAGSSGIRAGQTAILSNFGSIDVGQGGTASPGGAGMRAVDGATIRNESGGVIRVLGDGAAGLEAHDDGRLENVSGATIEVQGNGSAGIRANDYVEIENRGTITVTGTGATGILARSPLAPAPGVTQRSPKIAHFGTLTVSGDGAVGIRFGDDWLRNLNGQARVYSVAGSVINVSGDDGRGVLGGDNGFFATTGSIEVPGLRGRGIEVGFDSQVQVESAARIRVTGTDAVGVALGGNDHFGLEGDPRASEYSFSNRRGSIIRADSADAGPLVLFTGYGSGHNRVFNQNGASILADMTPGASPDRGIAIQGTDGVEVIENQGDIRGRILHGSGDDRYLVGPSSTFTGSLEGGPGVDTVELLLGSGRDPYDLGLASDFERLTIEAGGRWSVTGVGSYAETVVETLGTLLLQSGASATLSGSLRQQPTSLLDAEGDPTSWSVPLHVDGEVRLEPDGLIRFLPTAPVLVDATIVVLEADGGLVVEDPSRYLAFGETALLRAEPEFRPNELALRVTVLDFGTAATTPNQRALGSHLDAIDAAGPDAGLQALLDGLEALSPADYPIALDQLHPEAYDAQTSAILASADRMTSALLERPSYCIGREQERRSDPRTGLPCRTRPLEPWSSVFGLVQERSGDAGHTSHEGSAWGMLFGLDRRLGPGLLVSGSVGGSRHVLRVAQVGKARITTADFGLHAAWARGPLRLQGVAGYGYDWHESYRNIAFPGFARTAEARFNSHRLSGRLAGGWDFDLRGVRLAPVASLDWTALFRQGFDETGAGPASLSLPSRSDAIWTTRFGLELDTAYHKKGYWTDFLEMADGVWWPSLGLHWREVASGDDRPLDARLASAPAGVGEFRVRGADARHGFEVGAGLRFTPTHADRLTIGLRYDGFFWQGVREHDFGADVRLGF